MDTVAREFEANFEVWQKMRKRKCNLGFLHQIISREKTRLFCQKVAVYAMSPMDVIKRVEEVKFVNQ